MSSPTPYEPEEDDDDTSEYKPEIKPSQSSAPLPVPPSIGPTSSTAYPPVQTSRTERRSARGTRAQALEELQLSLSRESVEAYSSVLAGIIEDHAPVPTIDGGENHTTSQNGIVTWTPNEKEVLYHVLDRKSKNGIQEISRQLGSKSELEVQEHLNLLHNGLERQHLKDRHTRTIILGEVPAAAEISKDCCDELDQYAELVSMEEQMAEDVAGKQKHQDLWIINRETAEALAQEVKSQGADPTASSSAHLTAELFNMRKWIRLSERFFMNFGGARLEDNWANVAFADETPSMTADSFADFYALTVSLTRRLVQSSLFFAMSRLRNMRQTGNQKANVVRSRDVKTALDVLNMQRDRSDYWVGLARRCSLNVEDSRHRKGWKAVHMEHDEVEDILSGRIPLESESRERSASRGRSGSRAPGNTTDAEDADYSDESELSSAASSVLSSPVLSPVEEQPVDLEDDHAEQIDGQMSRLEEVNLWKLIGESPPQPLEAQIQEYEAQDAVPRRPLGQRKTMEDLVDWRDRTFYRSEWEEYGHDLVDLHDDLSENRRKRRRFNQDTVTEPTNRLVAAPNQQNAGLPDSHIGAGDSDDADDGDDYDEMRVDEPTPSKSEIEFPGREDSSPQDESPISEHASRLYHELEGHEGYPPRKDLRSGVMLVPSKATEADSPPSRRLRRAIKSEMDNEYGTASSTDDNLPDPRTASSEDEGSDEGMPLYSHPMSPADPVSD
ncbi:hypothetical protein CBS147343_2619 [Aspergillus niger]|nr:hypothetical protein CBS12448_11028 [Aspergillus niger]KAI2849082.1 hypothetical protein CBS11350_2234 [Aspergillus niger]KAI2911511.1 hypothetical protein CBS147371_8127 [Aspergillus niger]KAI2913674.1 hypothetical protein CBS147320_10491 [Aspergillus niger]KAI2941292.1 hypothetical protein CBS147322_9426 [Aspergillus niger]